VAPRLPRQALLALRLLPRPGPVPRRARAVFRLPV